MRSSPISGWRPWPASARDTASTTRRSCSLNVRCQPSVARGSTSRKKLRAARNRLKESRWSSQASQCFRRSAGWILGLFQRRSKVATWRQPRAEQVRSASSVMPSGKAIVSNVALDRFARNHVGFGWRFLSGGQLWRVAIRGVNGRSPTRTRTSVRLIGDHDGDQREEDGTGEQDPAKYSGNEDHADEAG